MTRADTTRDLWPVLGARNTADFQQQSLTRIRALLPRTNEPPIRLAPAAKQLGIKPTPSYEQANGAFRHGRLEYDENADRFEIYLCRNTERTEGRAASGHERYSYAHELAHRLFYVRTMDNWTRACIVATASLPANERFRARTAMEAAEERVCNRLASRFLVPDELLDQEDLQLDTTIGSLTALLDRLTEQYEVSRECMLLRLRDRITAGALAAPKELCALLIAYSNQDGPQGGAAWQYRVRLAIAPQWPTSMPLYPGIPVHRFGDDFAHEITRIANLRSESSGALAVTTEGGYLAGAWQRWGHGRNALIYAVGHLTPTESPAT